ncbi:MAG: hypothetical protein II008_10850 [Oscillospiraceae bacterium]|nr:hypothetical protein [Oscillospiraceae bacterium]
MAKAIQTEEAPKIDYADQLITVTLPRATGNEQNYELVSVNGKTWQIMKGVSVQVPNYVYDVLAESWRMEGRLQAFNEAQASRAIPG